MGERSGNGLRIRPHHALPPHLDHLRGRWSRPALWYSLVSWAPCAQAQCQAPLLWYVPVYAYLELSFERSVPGHIANGNERVDRAVQNCSRAVCMGNTFSWIPGIVFIRSARKYNNIPSLLSST